ncbi:sensor histidine kinase [Dankookia rubra]|uniref:sensor histidine kinase n=1 Tax=Dankookia rubra TaxID=1442381 RepID=UPI0014086587|nr:PAS domain-containing protein [Dankookia rubra]
MAAVILDRPALGVLAGNAEAAGLLGCRPERLPEAWGAALDGRAGQELRRRLAGVTSRDRPEVFDARLQLPDRAPKAMLVRARCVELEGWQVVSAVLVDITRRTRAEARLATAHRRLEVALAGAELGAWQRDLRTDLLEVTARWCEMLGLPPMKTVPVTVWRTLVHPEDQEVLRNLAQAQDAGLDGRIEVLLRLRHADGRWIPVLSRGEVIERDAEGRAVVLSGTHYDLSARHAAEAARRQSEAEARRRLADLETLYRSAPLGLAQFDRAMRFVRVNEALAEINGFPVEAHLGRLAWDLVPDLQAAAEPLFRRVLDQGETITGIEFTGQTARAPGVQRDWVEQFYPVRDPETQEILGVGIVCEEVTERKRAERTRELLLRELDHRVKNLFAIVSGLVSYSARGAATPQAMRNALLGRVGALARAHDLVRPAIAGLGADLPGTTLEALLRALLEPFGGDDGMPERLRLQGPTLPLGPTAAPAIALAVHEMATNAAKYGALSREGGTVTVDWTADGAGLRLRWTEQGGPAVATPAHRGFGHRLVNQSAAQLGGTAGFDWATDGLAVELLLPLGRVAG